MSLLSLIFLILFPCLLSSFYLLLLYPSGSRNHCGQQALRAGRCGCSWCFWWQRCGHAFRIPTPGSPSLTPFPKFSVDSTAHQDSTVLAYMLKLLNERHNYGIQLVLLSIDEGIAGYRDDSLETVKRNHDQYELPLTIVSYKVSWFHLYSFSTGLLTHHPCHLIFTIATLRLVHG